MKIFKQRNELASVAERRLPADLRRLVAQSSPTGGEPSDPAQQHGSLGFARLRPVDSAQQLEQLRGSPPAAAPHAVAAVSADEPIAVATAANAILAATTAAVNEHESRSAAQCLLGLHQHATIGASWRRWPSLLRGTACPVRNLRPDEHAAAYAE